jgi:hypothetical protein
MEAPIVELANAPGHREPPHRDRSAFSDPQAGDDAVDRLVRHGLPCPFLFTVFALWENARVASPNLIGGSSSLTAVYCTNVCDTSVQTIMR